MANIIRVRRSIDIDHLDFDGLISAIADSMDMDLEDIYLCTDDDADGSYPCYMGWLKGAELIPVEIIPVALEKAMMDIAHHESLLMVSVTSRESTHGAWLEIARDYPGAVITPIQRPGRIVYNILFPGTPAL